MARLHDVTQHPLLGEEAKALLGPKLPKLEIHVELAEQLLGITTDYAGSVYESKIGIALALQVNYQLGLGLDAFLLVAAQSQKSGVGPAYRGDEDGPPLVHPMSAMLVQQVFEAEGSTRGAYDTLTSVRGSLPGPTQFDTVRMR